MIIIKLKDSNLKEKPKGCEECPFINSTDELEYGEITGEVNYFCGALNNKPICTMSCWDWEPGYHIVFKNCPLISIEELED